MGGTLTMGRKMELFKSHYDAVCILGGGLKKEVTIWRTTRFNEGDNFGALGDTVRVIAGSYLIKSGLTDRIVVSGGKGQYKDNIEAPTVASVIKKELIDLGVLPDCIEEEDRSSNTYQQLKALRKIVDRESWRIVGIISNEYHLARIQAMIKYAPDLSNLTMANLISAESVLITYAPNVWQKIIEETYRSDEMKKRIAIERQGTEDIREGKYKF